MNRGHDTTPASEPASPALDEDSQQDNPTAPRGVAPSKTDCALCDGTAERLSARRTRTGRVAHLYKCRDCGEGGHLMLRDDEDDLRVGPVFRGTRRIVADGGVEEIRVCPECDASGIRRRSMRAGGADPGPDTRWKCRECKHYFDDPARRPRQNTGDAVSGTAKILAEMDPSEVPRA